MKRAPVKKKIKKPPKAEPTNPASKEPKQMAIVHRKNLLTMLNEASEPQLLELYQQIMGVKWKHGVAELGHAVRERMSGRKYSTE